ncbi:MAG: FKBP-type peptidyl-prolyl cis-trans isomerase [Fimbriiglobus sp.]
MADNLPATTGDGWKDLGDGLKMLEVVAGEGPECPSGARVNIHYRGWNEKGVQFDSTRDEKNGRTFSLGGLIRGWQIGIPGMKPGGVRRLVIPGPLAYGERGGGANIPPNATLVFDVKMLAFE